MRGRSRIIPGNQSYPQRETKKRNQPMSGNATPSPGSNEPNSKRTYVRYLSLGFELAASLGAPIWIGYMLDQRTQRAPWFTLGGIASGMILFFYTIFKTVQSVDRDPS